LKTLVTDDSKLARLSLIKVFKEFEPSCEIFQAENGEEAVATFERERPRIVFLDLTMPIMDGFEALERIMALDPKAQVVIVSADIQPKAQERVKALGAKMMVPKPISMEKMQQILINLHI